MCEFLMTMYIIHIGILVIIWQNYDCSIVNNNFVSVYRKQSNKCVVVNGMPSVVVIEYVINMADIL